MHRSLHRSLILLVSSVKSRAWCLILMLCLAQVVFFVPYLSLATDGPSATDDLYSFGKVIFLGIIGAVSLEVGPSSPPECPSRDDSCTVLRIEPLMYCRA